MQPICMHCTVVILYIIQSLHKPCMLQQGIQQDTLEILKHVVTLKTEA